MSWSNIILEMVGDVGIVSFVLVTLWAVWKFILKKCWVILNNAATTVYVDKSVDALSINLKEKIVVLDGKIEQYNDRTFIQYNQLEGKIDSIYKAIIDLALSGQVEKKKKGDSDNKDTL